MTNVFAPKTNVTLNLRKHPYRWNMNAWADEKEGEFSESFYFQIKASSGRPVITGVNPFPVTGQSRKQHFTINGRDFFSGCIVNLREKTDNNHLYGDYQIDLQTMRQITINPNFSTQTGDWTVEVVNPMGESSGEFSFRVLSPEDMALFEGDRQAEAKRGWIYFKWTLVSALAATVFTVALVIIVSLRRKKERSEIRRLASTEERERWAEELHDRLGSDFVNVIKLCERLDSTNATKEQKEIVSKMRGALLGAQGDIEDLLWAAKPDNQQMNWLIAHLRQNAHLILDAAGISFKPEFPPTLPEYPISATFCNHLLLLTKEALNNAVKHSGARNVMIGLQLDDTTFQMFISNDGKGFNPEKLSSGSGLQNMRRRMEKLGGTFGIKSNSGSGTCLHVSVPLASVKANSPG